MANETYKYLSCDAALTHKCRQEFEPDTVNVKFSDVRRLARQAGWEVVKGKDYCPECLIVKSDGFMKLLQEQDGAT